MSLWIWILAACAIAYATKLVGYLLPERWLETPWVSTLSHGVTVGLLASLVATNAFLTGTSQPDAAAAGRSRAADSAMASVQPTH